MCIWRKCGAIGFEGGSDCMGGTAEAVSGLGLVCSTGGKRIHSRECCQNGRLHGDDLGAELRRIQLHSVDFGHGSGHVRHSVLDIGHHCGVPDDCGHGCEDLVREGDGGSCGGDTSWGLLHVRWYCRAVGREGADVGMCREHTVRVQRQSWQGHSGAQGKGVWSAAVAVGGSGGEGGCKDGWAEWTGSEAGRRKGEHGLGRCGRGERGRVEEGRRGGQGTRWREGCLA